MRVVLDTSVLVAGLQQGGQLTITTGLRLREALVGDLYEETLAASGGTPPYTWAAVTPLPVIGVPVPLAKLDGLDSLLSIVQMPAGVPVATVAIGNARNAGLLAVRILAASDPALSAQMVQFQAALRASRGDVADGPRSST